MRIPTLLQKIGELSAQPERRTAIDVDLMLDYTRVLYADLLEWRSKLPATLGAAPAAPVPQPRVPDTPAAPAIPQKAAANITLPEQTHTITTPTRQPDKQDIRSLIGINDKYQIMSELFGNDKSAYEQSLDFINQSSSETVAMNWLREQLWVTEEHGEAAQSFYELVSRHFQK